VTESDIESRIADEIEKRLAPFFRRLEEHLSKPEQGYFGVPEAAAYVSCSGKSIRRAIKKGELACSNIGGDRRRAIRIDRKDLDVWMERLRLKQGETKSARQSLVDKFFPKKASPRSPNPTTA
jgi:excisionase family DNA binding protein